MWFFIYLSESARLWVLLILRISFVCCFKLVNRPLLHMMKWLFRTDTINVCVGSANATNCCRARFCCHLREVVILIFQPEKCLCTLAMTPDSLSVCRTRSQDGQLFIGLTFIETRRAYFARYSLPHCRWETRWTHTQNQYFLIKLRQQIEPSAG